MRTEEIQNFPKTNKIEFVQVYKPKTWKTISWKSRKDSTSFDPNFS